MQKVVSFYEKLPRGAAPEVEAKGLLARYQKRYMGKNPSARRAYSRLCTLRQAANYGSARPRYWSPHRIRLRTELLLPST
jgi:hypothetical protein